MNMVAVVSLIRSMLCDVVTDKTMIQFQPLKEAVNQISSSSLRQRAAFIFWIARKIRERLFALFNHVAL